MLATWLADRKCDRDRAHLAVMHTSHQPPAKPLLLIPDSRVSGHTTTGCYEINYSTALINRSIRTAVLEWTESLKETSTGYLPGGKGRPALKADNLTAVCES
jgi:hypothetical protein